MNAIVCNRCKKVQSATGAIGINLDIYSIRITSGSIKSPASIGISYLPLEFRENVFGVIHLCIKCFDDFMNTGIKTVQSPDVSREYSEAIVS